MLLVVQTYIHTHAHIVSVSYTQTYRQAQLTYQYIHTSSQGEDSRVSIHMYVSPIISYFHEIIIAICVHGGHLYFSRHSFS